MTAQAPTVGERLAAARRTGTRRLTARTVASLITGSDARRSLRQRRGDNNEPRNTFVCSPTGGFHEVHAIRARPRAGHVAVFAAGAAFAQQPIVIKFSHVVALDTPKGKGAENFKKLAEERLPRARSRSRSIPNSSLYKDGEEMEALQLGSVQMLAPSLAKFGPLGVREFEVFDLPYMFDNYAELHKVTERPGRRGAVQEARDQGHRRPRLLGQRLQGAERQQAAASCPPTTRA